MLRPITYAPQGHELVARAGVGFMDGLVQVPVVELQAADAERVVAALIGAGDEAVERDGHVVCGWCHVNQDHRIDQESSVADALAKASGRPGPRPTGEVVAASALSGLAGRASSRGDA